MMVLLLAIVLVFIVLLFEFRNFAAPIAILSSALLSTAGVFLALLVTGTTFNIASFMGLIMVIGIVAKNGILLLDSDQKFRAEGMSAHDAMVLAGRRRLRPIVMTALAAAAGMLPLALAPVPDRRCCNLSRSPSSAESHFHGALTHHYARGALLSQPFGRKLITKTLFTAFPCYLSLRPLCANAPLPPNC